jgi:hypothetical protein
MSVVGTAARPPDSLDADSTLGNRRGEIVARRRGLSTLSQRIGRLACTVIDRYLLIMVCEANRA